MSRDVKNAKTIEDAIYLLDRGKLPADLRAVVGKGSTREKAIRKLTDHFDPDASGEGDEDDYSDWTNDELRAELESRELDTSGNKAELVARLEESDFAEA